MKLPSKTRHNSAVCLIRFLIFFSFLLSFSTAIAESWYQVEVVVFDRLYPALDGEQWLDELYAPRQNMIELQSANQIESSQTFASYKILDENHYHLKGIYRYFKLSSEFRPLLHLSWQQLATGRRESRFVHIQKLDGEATAMSANNKTAIEPDFIESFGLSNKLIDGGIRVRSGFYLHVDVDLAYFKVIHAQNKIARASEKASTGNSEKTMISLKETRKIKLNEIHYFDHPIYGVIIQVSRL